MKNIRTIAFFMFTLAILLSVAILPILLSHFQDHRLLYKVYTTKAKKTISMIEPSLSTADKIGLIYDYVGNSKSIAMVEKKPALYSTLSNLPDAAIKEAKKLQRIGVFPKIKINDSLKVIDFYLRSFTDINSPGDFVQIGYISFSCGDNNFNILLDAETHVIYEFEVFSPSSLLNKNYKTLLKKEYPKYLNVKCEIINTNYIFGNEWYKVGKDKLNYQYLKLNTRKTTSSYLIVEKNKK